MYNVHCTMYIILCTMYTVHCKETYQYTNESSSIWVKSVYGYLVLCALHAVPYIVH